MPTTNDVVDQHMKSFRENDLDGVLADYSSDAVLFTPGRPLKGLGEIKPFFQAFLSEFAKPGASFSMRQHALRVITLTSCGVQKPRTIRTKPLPTRSLCGTEK
jgi:ketosteroid isomerase-like protein